MDGGRGRAASVAGWKGSCVKVTEVSSGQWGWTNVHGVWCCDAASGKRVKREAVASRSRTTLQILPFAPEVRGAYAFNGAFDEAQRAAEYDGSAAAVRCGFQAPSGFDLIRDSADFSACRVVVVNLVAKGRDVLLNAQNVAPHNAADPRVCFVSIMDVNGAGGTR